MSALYSSGMLGLHFPVCRAGRELNVSTCKSPLASIQTCQCMDTHLLFPKLETAVPVLRKEEAT